MIEIIAWAGWTLAALCTVEYLSHRYPMHRPSLPIFRGALRRHAILHHRDGRNDVNVDLPAWFGVALASPLLAVLLLLGLYVPLAVVACLAVAYCHAWTGLHRSFHGLPGGTPRFPFHDALLRHHLAHHRDPTGNFGTVFGPTLDHINGTHRP